MEQITKFKNIIDDLNKMELKDTDLFIQAHLMKNMSRILDERMEEINKIVLEDMVSKKLEKQTFDYGTFTVAKRAKYTYTEKVDNLSEQLKKQKKVEEATGEAKKEETIYLLIK